MTPAYQSDRVLIWHGDMTDVLRHWTMPVATILTEPPHLGMEYIHDLNDGARAWDEALMARWLAARLAFFHSWLPACHQMVGDGPCWVHLQIHQVFAFQAMAYWERWQAMKMWQLSAEEGLLFLCHGAMLTEEASLRVLAMKRLNRFNQPKPVAWLKVLLEMSREGPVFDPMMGSGSTLVAGLELGRPVIGIEKDPAICAQAITRVREAERVAA